MGNVWKKWIDSQGTDFHMNVCRRETCALNTLNYISTKLYAQWLTTCDYIMRIPLEAQNFHNLMQFIHFIHPKKSMESVEMPNKTSLIGPKLGLSFVLNATTSDYYFSTGDHVGFYVIHIDKSSLSSWQILWFFFLNLGSNPLQLRVSGLGKRWIDSNVRRYQYKIIFQIGSNHIPIETNCWTIFARAAGMLAWTWALQTIRRTV